MPFETESTAPRRIAVIGAGISGMGAAHMLGRDHRVVLYEAENRLGGHARTRMAGPQADTPVDTGFIVFNRPNYPHLVRLFEELEVPTRLSNMSFGASLDSGRFEYALRDLSALFAQPRNGLDPRFLRMLRDIVHFNRNALQVAEDGAPTIEELLRRLKTGAWFRDRYLLPLSGAIWSTPKERILDFPARAMMEFFRNHALLSHTGQHDWYTVEGGSQEYVKRLESALRRRDVDMRLGAAVDEVRRTSAGVTVKTAGAEPEPFDEVVFATHSDDTLRLLGDPTARERRVLGAIRYQPNRVVLHSDESLMPRRRKVWSSWIYSEERGVESDGLGMTYWMNSLQPWLTGRNYFVTLNPARPVREETVWDYAELRHPVYDLAALQAQKEAAEMNGAGRTWFCGAWMRNGFHEDGLASAVEVVRGIAARETTVLAAE